MHNPTRNWSINPLKYNHLLNLDAKCTIPLPQGVSLHYVQDSLCAGSFSLNLGAKLILPLPLMEYLQTAKDLVKM